MFPLPAHRRKWRVAALPALLWAGVVSTSNAQELEPRAYSPNPTGLNFALLAYAHSTGEVLFDQSLPFEIDFSYTVGATRMLDPAGQNVWEASFQWALQRDFFSKDFALFIHGFYNAATLPRVPQPSQPVIADGHLRQNAVGAGFIWTANPRLAVYGQWTYRGAWLQSLSRLQLVLPLVLHWAGRHTR